MSRLSRPAAVAGALALAAAVAPSAFAADTTAPSLSVSTGPNFAGVVAIYNSGGSTSFGGNTTSHINVSGPGVYGKSSEDGTITFTLRDAVTGARKGAATVPATANQRVAAPTGDERDPAAPSILPVTTRDCSSLTSGWCGVKQRLPALSLLRIDTQATDAAGNRSATRSTIAVVLPDLIIPIPY